MHDAGQERKVRPVARTRGRDRWWPFERLSVRLALGTALIVVGPIAAGFYLISSRQYDKTVEAEHHSALMQSRILEAALRHQMVDKDPELLAAVLREIGSQPEVRNALILNHEGEVRAASRPEQIGEVISRESPSCMVCHSQDPEERGRWVVYEDGAELLLRTVTPIENRLECTACHDPSNRVNGILLMDTSLAGLKAEARHDRAWILGGAILVAAFLMLGVGALVRVLVLGRLERLSLAARSFGEGNLAERAIIGGDDVIGSLAKEFNDMAGSVSRLVGELSAQEAQLASVMDSLTDGLVVLDRDSRVVASNRAFCRRLGSHPEALRGRACSAAIDGHLPCCTSGEECPAERCLATGEVQRVVYRSASPDGSSELVEEVYASPVFDQDGAVVQTVEVWRDITERAKEEERLAEIERLISLGTLASGFSHEVSTPLASTLVCAESILAQIEERDGAAGDAAVLTGIREHAGTIREQVLRCRRITDQFMRFSRGIPPSVEPVDLRSAVGAAVSLVAPTARGERVELRFEDDGPVPEVMANAEVVQHVTLNLLLNAVQSCDAEGGEVVLGFVVGDDVRLRIRDTGCGIAPQDRARIFEPFQSHKVGGTGLGLFLSRTFMRRFGGDVRLVETVVGGGSTLEIVFVRAPEADDG